MAETPPPKRKRLRKARSSALIESIRQSTPGSDTDDELADRAVDEAIEWLIRKWGNDKACPYCDNTYWTVGSSILGLPALAGGGAIPFLQVTCNNCGQSTLLSVQEVVRTHLEAELAKAEAEDEDS